MQVTQFVILEVYSFNLSAEALAFADRVIILDMGQIVHDGPVEALRANRSILERYVGVGLSDA